MTTAAAFVARAQAAAAVVARAPTAQKNDFLRAFARSLRAAAAAVARANRADMAAAKDLPPPLVERLSLARDGIEKTALGIEAVAALADPIGEISHLRPLPSGIRVGKMRVPLGVILLIYESRPAVTADAAALIVKAGNAAILRGGKESARTNRALAAPLARALAAAGLPESAAQIVTDPARALVGDLLRSDGIDLIVPRGGRELITRVAAEARAPMLKHLDGNCHIFVDADCDIDSARRIVVNAKTRRYGVCNALESLLVHKKLAKRALPLIAADLAARGVEIRACAKSRKIIGIARCRAASADDWAAEYLAPIVSVKIVDSLAAAIAHINRFGSGHTDAILTENRAAAERFLREVDSASVIVNASTGFADGFEYGLGAEIGISTGKLHARGPVGLEGLTCEKYIALGAGEIRA